MSQQANDTHRYLNSTMARKAAERAGIDLDTVDIYAAENGNGKLMWGWALKESSHDEVQETATPPDGNPEPAALATTTSGEETPSQIGQESALGKVVLMVDGSFSSEVGRILASAFSLCTEQDVTLLDAADGIPVGMTHPEPADVMQEYAGLSGAEAVFLRLTKDIGATPDQLKQALVDTGLMPRTAVWPVIGTEFVERGLIYEVSPGPVHRLRRVA